MKKKIIFATIIVVLLIAVYQGFFKKEGPSFTLAEVTEGNIVQEISETGEIIKGKQIDLSFKSSGEIEKIYVEVDQIVDKGEALTKLDTTDLEIQLKQAKASLELAQMDLERLLAGARPEEIKIAETQVENAKNGARIAQENLDNSYDKSIAILEGSYLPIYNTVDFVKGFVIKYVIVYDEDGKKIMEARDKIESGERKAKNSLEKAKSNLRTNEDIDTAISTFRNSLELTLDNLEIIREVTKNSVFYQNEISTADRTSLDKFKAEINSALINVIGTQQTVALMKLNLETAQTKLQEAETHLELVKSGARDVDIKLYEAKIKQAQAQVEFYENQIEKSTLRSPVKAQVIAVNKKEGEAVQPMLKDVIISLLPVEPFQVEVDVPEVDIGKISLGDPAKIVLDAFPENEFSGEVIEINPVETVISGVVYYKTKVSLETENTNKDEQFNRIKPGMTANVTIITDSRENVLMIPQRAVIEKEGRKIVRVPIDNKNYKEVEVETGLRGSKGEIEIISGLKKGDKVITFLKEK